MTPPTEEHSRSLVYVVERCQAEWDELATLRRRARTRCARPAEAPELSGPANTTWRDRKIDVLFGQLMEAFAEQALPAGLYLFALTGTMLILYRRFRF